MKRGSRFYAFKATEYADLFRPRLVDHQAVIAQRRSGTSVGAAVHRRCVVARKWTQSLMSATSAHCAISSGHPSMRGFRCGERPVEERMHALVDVLAKLGDL